MSKNKGIISISFFADSNAQGTKTEFQKGLGDFMDELQSQSACEPDVNLLVSVITEVSSITLENGGEVSRAEEICERIGNTLGAVSVNVFAIPTALCIALEMPSGIRSATICRVKKRSIRLDVLDQANTISRQLVEKRMTLTEAQESLKLLRQKDSISLLKATICSGGAAAFFAMLYGGGWIEFFCALLAGMCSYLTMNLIEKFDSSQLIKALAGSFTAAIIARALKGPFSMVDESMVIIGAIMPMLPGLAVTNAIRDMMHGDLVSGNAKLFEGILTACAIAGGVFMALNFI